MCDQAIPTNNTTTESKPKPRFELTTKTLGIADSKEKDLAGYVLNYKEISEAVCKTLIAVGIPSDSIRGVIVGSDADRNIKIFIDLIKKKLKPRKKTNFFEDAFDVDDYEYNSNLFPKDFYNALRNKAYFKHLKQKEINKPKKKNSGSEKCIRLEFDAEIFIAFAYNIDFSDEFYKVKPDILEFKKNKELRNSGMNQKEINRYMARQKSYIDNKLLPCNAIVIFSKEGFHPNQVPYMMDDEN